MAGSMVNVPRANVYPTAYGMSLGVGAGTMAGDTDYPEQTAIREGEADEGSQEVADAILIGGQANPVVGLAVFVGMTAGVMVLAARMGEGGDFSNLRASAYNVLLVSLIATAGIPVWKFLFTRVKVPGVSTWVQAI